MITQDKLFSMALKCIPPSEKVKSQMVTLSQGDLYFMSSTRNSWFVIEKFFDTDISFRMTVENLRIILALGGNIIVSRVEGSNTRMRFTSGPARIDSGVFTDIEVPVIRMPPDDSLIPIPAFFTKASKFNSISDENTRMSSIEMEDSSTLYLLETRRSLCGICYTGDDIIFNSNFTNTYEAMNEAALAGGKYYSVRDLLYLVIKPDDNHKITSCMRLTPPLATQEARAIAGRFIVGQAWKNLEHIKISVSMHKYNEVMNIVSKLDFTGDAVFEVRDNTLKITVADNLMREYEHYIPCESNGGIIFTTFLIPQAYLRILQSVDTTVKKEDFMIDLCILETHSKMIASIRTPEENYFPFILYQVKI